MTQSEWRLWVLERQVSRLFFGRTANRAFLTVLAAGTVYFIVRGAVALVFGK